MRVLGIDPGQKRIGVAISDPTGTIARPLAVLVHISRQENARRIAALAEENGCELIIIGQALNADGAPTDASRRAAKLAEVLSRLTEVPVRLWDEGGSTQKARSLYLEMGVPQKKRRGHLDDAAAAVILRDFLETHSTAGTDSTP